MIGASCVALFCVVLATTKVSVAAGVLETVFEELRFLPGLFAAWHDILA